MATWTGAPALPNLFAGDIPSATEWGAILSAVHGLTDAWTAYTPVWTATTTNPVLGNATVDSAYIRSGKYVTYVGNITMGSTTTYGTGAYLLSVPVNLAAAARAIGIIYLSDASTPANDRMGLLAGSSASQVAPLVSGGNVSPTNPFPFAVSDAMRWAITYEAA
jgi:hypothetical protein